MEQYIFVCIGTNRLIADSLGPRIGEKLEKYFKNYQKVKVFGTMKSPIHYKNAPFLLTKLSKKEQKQIILIDSALAENEEIGNTYISSGGVEIGKAYGKGFYFPAFMNIKTVIGNKRKFYNWNIKQIDLLAESIAKQVKEVVCQAIM